MIYKSINQDFEYIDSMKILVLGDTVFDKKLRDGNNIFFVRDFFNLNFIHNDFDFIVCGDYNYTIENKKVFYKKCYGILKKGGRLMLLDIECHKILLFAAGFSIIEINKDIQNHVFIDKTLLARNDKAVMKITAIKN